MDYNRIIEIRKGENQMDNKSIIIRISQELDIKIPKSRGYQEFSIERLIEHLSYWISFSQLEEKKHSKSFYQSWEKMNHEDILKESISDELFSELFPELNHNQLSLDLGI